MDEFTAKIWEQDFPLPWLWWYVKWSGKNRFGQKTNANIYSDHANYLKDIRQILSHKSPLIKARHAFKIWKSNTPETSCQRELFVVQIFSFLSIDLWVFILHPQLSAPYGHVFSHILIQPEHLWGTKPLIYILFKLQYGMESFIIMLILMIYYFYDMIFLLTFCLSTKRTSILPLVSSTVDFSNIPDKLIEILWT